MSALQTLALQLAKKRIEELEKEKEDLWQFVHNTDSYINHEKRSLSNPYLQTLKEQHNFLINRYTPTNWS